ncbi:hypothetical protein K443DRAFT_672096 [Laccaria amethystina LaAM-08-1]|uniref:Zn(2)-C6 fungal-type domain-containing protein n=1 Tax=Laccaria amethystina LaAM-08-1 TaxID=1095629 RepID=A0A0C9XVL4_9AGAR|nr:hypothetical protein K443DRAFT_672096 [Laccaria amethystina LaAM-08-1]
MSAQGKKNAGGITDTSAARKLGLSCAECRRSKLKCDRVFPCQSCQRRGCANICPDGTLAATKGNKVLMAHAQRLSETNKTLTSRIHELESALAQAHAKDDGTHPLLQPDLNLNPDGDHDNNLQHVSEAIGSLSIGLDGQSKYHGESAGSEYFQDLLPSSQREWSSDSQQFDLPREILDLMNAFPFGLKDCPHSKNVFIQYIPSRDRAQELASLYYTNIAWMYDPIIEQDFTTTILDLIYGTTGFPSLDTLHSHRLSVFFILLANGMVFDSHPSSPNLGRQYHALARAALSLDSILLEATCATVQALFLMFRFIYNADRSCNEERWLLTGLSARLSQTIGLQRDSANWSLPADEVQRRRRLFWDLFTWDSWSGVVNGRPAALMIQHTDCQFPDDLDSSIKPTGEVDFGWHAWKVRYAATCLTASAHHVFSPRTPPYTALLEIDKKIRKFAMPSHLRSPTRNSETGRSWSTDPSRAMQQYCALCLRESNLLYIHRSYFVQAIRQDPDNPLRHKYAPSVLATYRSACRLISSLKGLYPIHPRISSYCWYFWSGIFSACIVLGALVVESPGCTLAGDALRELEATVSFYEEGSRPCRAPATMAILEKLCQRASTAYKGGAEKFPQKVPTEVDELEVLGGRKSVITTTSCNNSPSNPPPGSPDSLHLKVDEGNSPASQAGAAEMLIEYYEELGQPPFDIHKGHDYDMDQGPLTYTSSSYGPHPKPRDPSALPSPPQSYLGHYIPSLPMHDPSQYPSSSRQLQSQSETKPTHAWHASYAAAHHTHPSHASIPVTFGNVDAHGHQHHPPYRYVSGPESNQEDIWRNFMMEFQGTATG